jgi:hypothetical protein
MPILKVKVSSVERDTLYGTLKSLVKVKVYQVVETRPGLQVEGWKFDNQSGAYPLDIEIHFNASGEGLKELENLVYFVLMRPVEIVGRDGVMDFVGAYDGCRVKVQGPYTKGTVLYGKVGVATLVEGSAKHGTPEYYVAMEDGTKYQTSYPASELSLAFEYP